MIQLFRKKQNVSSEEMTFFKEEGLAGESLNEREKRHMQELVKSGKYYDNMKSWYNLKYLAPASERSYLLIIAIACIFACVLAFKALINMLPVHQGRAVFVEVEDSRYFPQQYKISRQNDSDEIAKQRVFQIYLVKFVEAYESYTLKKRGEQLQKYGRLVKQLGSAKIYKNYLARLDIKNMDGFLLKYRNHTTREVITDSNAYTKIINPAMQPDLDYLQQSFKGAKVASGVDKSGQRYYTAIVDFVAKEKTIKGQEQQEIYRAKIDFNASDIVYDKLDKKFLPFTLKIDNYEVIKIN
jgi:type IV secretory pathway component VirB8